jgi:3-hydroxyisobutyrate dehydrogenase-like beta-hydroxyacid dehydrogenase
MTVAIVSPGHMGSGLGWALRQGGARVVSTVEGRSARTARLAADFELLPSLRDVVAVADVVLVVTPPGASVAAARSIRAAAHAVGACPLVADLNAVSPATMMSIVDILAPLDVVDGSISGPPPTVRPGASVYFSGPRADELVALPWGGLARPIRLGDRVGAASAVKMSTASVYKGLTGLITQAIRSADFYGVLDEVLADLARSGLETGGVALAATKAHRYVPEMREIAKAQADAGLTSALFEAYASIYAEIAGSALAAGDPETVDAQMPASEVVAALASRISGD